MGYVFFIVVYSFFKKHSEFQVMKILFLLQSLRNIESVNVEVVDAGDEDICRFSAVNEKNLHFESDEDENISLTYG